MNNSLFITTPGRLVPSTDTFNAAGGRAYKMTPKQALAQYVTTGCLNNTYYVSAQMQLESVINLCKEVDQLFIMQCAIYARHKGFMKDMPTLLVAYLGVTQSSYFCKAFDEVIDNGKMLRNFVQVVRSGVLGRKSFGSTMKRKVIDWLNNAGDYKLINANIGNKPSLVDVLRMVHPKAPNDERNELYKWILGKEHNKDMLPGILKVYELWKLNPTTVYPTVPFQMLTQTPLDKHGWMAIAANAPWHMCRMNLNTFKRHGVFEDVEYVMMVARKLKDKEAIQKARVYPYQLMIAYLNIEPDMPYLIKEALQDALEIATANVPEISGRVVIGVDISGSMSSPVSGHRGSVTSKARYVDVAALFGASLLRMNPTAQLVPFHGQVVRLDINPRDTIMTNAKRLADACTNGTDLSTVFKYIIYKDMPVDLVIIVSDSESWIDSPRSHFYSQGTQAAVLWEQIKAKNKAAKLICINISPEISTQVVDRDDIFNIAGFSDTIFDYIALIANNKGKDFVTAIEEAYTMS